VNVLIIIIVISQILIKLFHLCLEDLYTACYASPRIISA
jgi:hypothetical protein